MSFIPYEIIKLLGWTTAILVSLSLLFHILLTASKIFEKIDSDSKSLAVLKKGIKKALPFFYNYHSAFGIMAIMTGITHGYLMLRAVELHSGYVLWSSVAVLGITGLILTTLRDKKIYKKLRIVHRIFMFFTAALMVLHITLM